MAVCHVDKQMSALSGSNGLKDYGPQIKSWTSRLDCSISWTSYLHGLPVYLIYSRTITCILMDPIVSCPFLVLLFQYLYCPLDTLFSLFTLPLSVLFIVLDLDSLLFCSVASHAIVLHLDNSTRMYKQSTLYALVPQFLLTHCGTRLVLSLVITVPSHSLWYQLVIYNLLPVLTIHCILLTHTILTQPCDLP